MSSTDSDSFAASFMIWMPFVSLSALARSFNTVLNKSSESEHPYLVPHLRGKAFRFSLLNMLAVGL